MLPVPEALGLRRMDLGLTLLDLGLRLLGLGLLGMERGVCLDNGAAQTERGGILGADAEVELRQGHIRKTLLADDLIRQTVQLLLPGLCGICKY